MYSETLTRFASHGFTVVFPFIKDEEKDTNWW